MENNPAIIFDKPKSVIIENRQIPEPAKGELLIETQYTMISTGTELTVLNGEYPEGSVWDRFGRFPFTPGYNNIGKVVDAGNDEDRCLIGKKVATYGPHAKFFAEDAHNARIIHRDIPDEHAVFFTLSEIVMNSIRRSHIQWGESAAVFGQGLLGQLAVRFLRLCGAQYVFALDISDKRLEKLPEDKNIIRINSKKEDVVRIVESVTKGRMADVAFEVTGAAGLIPDEFKVLRKQGRLVVLSSPRGKTQFDFHDMCNSPSFTIIGAHNFSHPQHETLDNPWTMKRHAEFFFDLVCEGELDVEPLISHREHYTRAVDIYRLLMKDRSEAMGVVLNWS